MSLVLMPVALMGWASLAGQHRQRWRPVHQDRCARVDLHCHHNCEPLVPCNHLRHGGRIYGLAICKQHGLVKGKKFKVKARKDQVKVQKAGRKDSRSVKTIEIKLDEQGGAHVQGHAQQDGAGAQAGAASLVARKRQAVRVAMCGLLELSSTFLRRSRTCASSSPQPDHFSSRSGRQSTAITSSLLFARLCRSQRR